MPRRDACCASRYDKNIRRPYSGAFFCAYRGQPPVSSAVKLTDESQVTILRK